MELISPSTKPWGIFCYKCWLIIVLICAPAITRIFAQAPQRVACTSRRSRCFLRAIICPRECPTRNPKVPTSKACYVNCESPICKAECRNRIPNCNGLGAACYDPRLIGADGVVFYFHGKRNEHFSLVSDTNLQLNACFIGLRPAERRRDYTWIQGLGVLFGSHNFSVEATKATTWDDNVDHLKFSYDGKEIILPDSPLSQWNSQENDVKLERISSKNNVVIFIPELVEISVNVVPITREDDRIHNYQIPSDDCFAHLEVQFRFFSLSPKVEGVLGRTYQTDFESPAKLGVAMPVVGGEDKYRTTSLFSTDSKNCMFSPVRHSSVVADYGMLDCSSKSSQSYAKSSHFDP